MDEKAIQRLNTAISVVFIVAAAALFIIALRHRGSGAPTPAPQAATGTPETAAFDDLAGMRQLQLAKGFASWTPDAKIDEGKTRALSLAVKGQVAKAYLGVSASVAGKPLTKYESVFVKFNDVGGHLFRPRSLKTPDDAGPTRLLYDLNELPVLPSVPYDETRKPTTAVPYALFKDGRSVRLTAFISSLRPALLEDLSISYVCAEGSDCAIAAK